MLNFDQKMLLESISKNLDSLAEIIKWAILFSVALWWAGFQRQNPIEALGVKIQREHAFFLGVIVYSVVNLVVLIRFLRLGDLLNAVSDASLTEGITRLSTHAWELNPFSYFGLGLVPRAHSCLGYGSLIAVWWICNSSLDALGPETGTSWLVLLCIYLFIGLASMWAVQRVNQIVLVRTETSQPELHSLISKVQKERMFFAIVGICIGSGVAFATGMISRIVN